MGIYFADTGSSDGLEANRHPLVDEGDAFRARPIRATWTWTVDAELDVWPDLIQILGLMS